ncbi:DUF262 domain-containing protein [Lysobacter soli]|uniref:DUF262 domain-containing protein n=1 Tax=Lysobacter soli TaxID=453783 RepID=UPI00209D18B4|nr:DUF262 domain-containing protein [Lysobacter soli]UTA53521.1 DUF262 domain-containing protein [Lysobacter soli]
MDFQPVTYTVDKIISLLRAGRLALPEFQRDFVWSPAKVVELLDSVSRGWPVGSLLLLRGPQPFEAKAIDAGPPLRGDVDVFALDGQQRITALFHALADVSDVCYYVDFEALARGEQDYILWKRRSQFDREYSLPRKRASQGIALIREVADNEEFFNWQSHLAGDAAHRALSLRETHLSGLKSKVYRLPVVELEHEIELEALARIFETINRTGVKLNAFDLMVAVLYPHKFNLRNEWEDALLRYPLLNAFEVDGIEILKLIAIWVRREQQARRARISVRGVRQGDVLAIPPVDVKRSWHRAIESYSSALQMLVGRLGVAHPSLSPPQAMILAIAAFADPSGETTVSADRVEKWYWNSIKLQSYAQGANTRVISDVDTEVRGELEISVPAAEVSPALLEPVRRNKILVNGIGSALAVAGARDIKTGLLLSGADKGAIVARSLHSLARGDARPDENSVVASVVFAREHSFLEIAAAVRRGQELREVCDSSALGSQLVFDLDFANGYASRVERLQSVLDAGGRHG